MTSKAEDKVEIVVQVESKDTSSKVILIMLIIVLVGLVIAVMMTGGPDALLSNDDDDRGVGNCGDGIDNDCLLYTSPSPRDKRQSRMPSSA